MELQKPTPTSDDHATSFSSWSDHLSLEEFLGSGSFSFVFKAINANQRLSAVKIIFQDTIGKSVQEVNAEKQRISQEYQLIQGKEHNNLVKILSSIRTNFTSEDFEHLKNLKCLKDNPAVLGILQLQCLRLKRSAIPTFCIETELCGKTLRQWLNSHTVENPELSQIKLEIIHGLARGLTHLHENNIIHRGFCPENVMFAYSPTEAFALPIQIGDFGLSRTREQSKNPVKPGNEWYHAPETIENKYSKQSDLFSFGLVIWEVGQSIPFKDRSSMFYKLVYESETDLVKVSQTFLREAIISLTQRRVQERAKVIPKSLLRVHVEGLFIVENIEEFCQALELCKPGDTIELGNFPNSLNFTEFQLNTNNVTICGQEGSSIEIVGSLDIRSNDCKIKSVKFRGLIVTGNNNIISHSIFDSLELAGNNNKMIRCVFGNPEARQGSMFYNSDWIEVSGNRNIFELCTVHCPTYEVLISGSHNTFGMTNFLNVRGLGVIISGEKNTIQNFCMTIDTSRDIATSSRIVEARLEMLGINLEVAEFSGMFPLCLIITPESSQCIITEGILENGFMSGRKHKLMGLTVKHTLKLKGNGHSIKNCKGHQLQNESDDSRVDFLQLEED